MALDHCTLDFAAQILKNLISKNPSALLWPRVKNWMVDPEDGEILNFDQKPIISILSRLKPSLMTWLARTYPSILEFESRSSDGRTETIGSIVSKKLISWHGSADTICSFFKEYPSGLAPANKIPVVLLHRLAFPSE